MRRMMSFLSGAVMGALVGATVAILMAPYSGEELRDEIRGRALRFKDELSEAAQSRRIELEKQLASLREPKKGVPVEEG